MRDELVKLTAQEAQQCREHAKQWVASLPAGGVHPHAVAFGVTDDRLEDVMTRQFEDAFLHEKKKRLFRESLPPGVVWEMDVREIFSWAVCLGRGGGLSEAAVLGGDWLAQARECQRDLRRLQTVMEGVSGFTGDLLQFLRGRVAGVREGGRLLRAGRKEELIARLRDIQKAIAVQVGWVLNTSMER